MTGRLDAQSRLYRLGRLWRTVRPLKRDQIVYRLRNALVPAGRPKSGRPPLRQPEARWIDPQLKARSRLSESRFKFLGHEAEVAHAADWNSPELPKLWLYNAHYFDDLNAAGAEGRRDSHCRLMRRWIAENPPAVGNGWEPYTLSLRIVNWIKWSLREGMLDRKSVV